MKKYLCIFCVMIFLFFLPDTLNAETARITFTNKRTENTSLYISKTVDSAVSGIDAPQDEAFSFSLRLDNSIAKEMSYRLFGNSGQEIYNYNGTLTTQKDEAMIATPFKTDRNGVFQLKGGQTACFENIKAGVFYEVSEEQREDYLQIEPAGGGSAVGNMIPNGNAVTFHNRYIPKLPGENEQTILEIQKNIAFPPEYNPPESPDFLFTVTIRGKAWGNETYAVLDADSEEILSHGTTDANGCFSIKGGQKARFENIPSDSDYKITEKETEGWKQISCFGDKGATVFPLTYASFTNTEASFVITKELDKPTVTETPFLFELKKEGLPWQEAEYYLYETSGIQADEEVHRTDLNGFFSLFPGQAAVFVRIPSGTAYSVSEKTASDYTQTVPPDAQGYTNKIVTDSIEILPFINHAEIPSSLFLQLIKKDSDGVYLSGAVFQLYADQTLTEEICEITTNKEGIAKLGEILPGTYYVKETVSPAGYRLLTGAVKLELQEDCIIVNGHTYSGSDITQDAYFQDSAKGKTACVTIYNQKNFRLPLTGGKGILLFAVIGIAGIFTAVIAGRNFFFVILDKQR